MGAYSPRVRNLLRHAVLAAGLLLIFSPRAARAQSCTVNVATDDSGTTGDLRYRVAQGNAYTSGTAVT